MISGSPALAPKIFVLDTNVILHDSDCIQSFEENDIYIPITVIEELDRFKKGSGEVHYHARNFLRRIDDITGDVLATDGAPLGAGLGSIRVVLGGEGDDALRTAFYEDSPDHRILATALRLQRTEPQRRVILVSKDTNLRMKAKSLGLVAQDYTSDKVESFEKLYAGKRVVENVDHELIDAFYADGGLLSAERIPLTPTPVANENFIFRNGSKSAMATYRPAQRAFLRVEKISAYGIRPRNAEQSFALTALLNPDISLVSLVGKAGTGKTLLALAAALESRANCRQILLARPVVPLGNHDIGYLPGDIAAKLDPHMQPLYDNLAVIRHQYDERDPAAQRIQEMLASEKLLITPLAYIRGRSLQRAILIVDEAQNLTPHEVKTIITRAGEGTKIIFTGDIQQIDHPYLDTLSNGLSYLINRMVGQPIYAHVTLEKGERSALADLASRLL
jgi:PhoH-like ATPase